MLEQERTEHADTCSGLQSLLSGGHSLLLVVAMSPLLSIDHDLESIEISGLSPFVESVHLLLSAILGPLLFEVESFGGFLDSGCSGTSQDWKSHLGQSQSLDWIQGPWEVAEAIDEHSAHVCDVSDHNHFSIVFSEIDKANSTWFNDVSNSLNIIKRSPQAPPTYHFFNTLY